MEVREPFVLKIVRLVWTKRIPHSDVSLKSLYLARNDIRNQGVQYIIDSAIQSLLDNPDRRFIYVEMAFFWRWWNQQTEDMQNTVKQLVNTGYFIKNTNCSLISVL